MTDILLLNNILRRSPNKLVVINDKIIDWPIVSRDVEITSSTAVRSMILASRVIFSSEEDIVVEEGGRIICGELYRNCSCRIKGGEINAGEVFFKPGKHCNYVSVSDEGNSEFSILLRG
ncbi:MAG: hypothetical protein WA091_03730 [Minisyncoccales bacterium]